MNFGLKSLCFLWGGGPEAHRRHLIQFPERLEWSVGCGLIVALLSPLSRGSLETSTESASVSLPRQFAVDLPIRQVLTPRRLMPRQQNVRRLDLKSEVRVEMRKIDEVQEFPVDSVLQEDLDDPLRTSLLIQAVFDAGMSRHLSSNSDRPGHISHHGRVLANRSVMRWMRRLRRPRRMRCFEMWCSWPWCSCSPCS